MKEKAIAKINAEMQKNPADVYTEIIGHYIIDRCTDDITAAKVAEDGKTLKGAMLQVSAAARKKAKNNTAVLLPAEVFDIVDQYFGIAKDEAIRQRTIQGVAPAPVPTAQALNLNLDDFL